MATKISDSEIVELLLFVAFTAAYLTSVIYCIIHKMWWMLFIGSTTFFVATIHGFIIWYQYFFS